MIYRSIRTSIILGVALAALVATALPAAAGHQWGDYAWSDAPTSLRLGDRLSGGDWDALLGDVVADWNQSNAVGFQSGAGTGDCKSAVVGTVQVCNGRYGSNGWLGLATIWINGSTIIAGAAQVNDSYLVDNPSYDDAIARRHVLCQEIGHTLGLGHVKGPRKASCMNDQFGLFDPAFQAPDAHDYDQLAAIYGSGADSGGSGPTCKPGSKNPHCQFGEHVHVTREGGRTRVTWIIPA